MENRLFREYQFKFYLNAGHSISFNGQQGETHPHTWEFLIDILIQRENFVEYHVYEKAIEQFFAKYQDQKLNDLEPFDTVIPTLENIVDCFGQEIRQIIDGMGGLLRRIEGSETPTRSYMISYENDGVYLENLKKYSMESISGILDSILDTMIDEGAAYNEEGMQTHTRITGVCTFDLPGHDGSISQ